jgi:HSP20 family protein
MTVQGRWDPWKELLAVQKRMNQLFDGALGGTEFDAPDAPDTWTPVCDAYETPGAFVVCLELPGLAQSAIDLRLDGDELVVAGERQRERAGRGQQFHRVERSYGKFARRFRLPSAADRSAVDASYRDGVLRVTVAKREGDRSGPVRVAIH